MTTEQWQKVKEIYDEMATQEPAEWPARLAAASADEAVRTEVEQLLRLQLEAREFLEHPPRLDPALARNQDQSGKQVGAYRLLGEIGRGGMGTVYLAERADDLHRKQVAVKLVWPGFDSAEIFHRFRQERHILAELDHPNIARLLDGGTTREGWPYVVMEYVPGQPVTRFANERKLSTTERLALFRQVCDAVSYAHRNLVIHRDLKPSNILVTEDGTVKLLDFGIAKILDPALRPDALSLTSTGMQAMTPEYASPEQARGEAITTATDVYSLGVMLYELLTGHQPYRFPKRVLHEVMRVIAEEEPLRPSQISHAGSVPRAVASGTASDAARSVITAVQATEPISFDNAQENTPDKLRRRLQGDLDNVILKALRKEPEQRYSSVEQFSEDIARHLAGKTVIARKPTISYRTRKFVRRNKAWVAFIAFVAATLIGVTAFSLRQSWIARQQAREARRDAYHARLNQALQDFASGNVKSARALVESYLPKPGEEDLRGFEWRHIWGLLNREELTLPHDDWVQWVAFPWNEMPVTRIKDFNSVRFWDLKTGQFLKAVPIIRDFHLFTRLNDGTVLQPIDDHTVKWWRAPGGEVISTITDPASAIQTFTTEFNGNEKTLWTGGGDGSVKNWDLETGRLRYTFKDSGPPVTGVSKAQRHQWLLIVQAGDSRAELWDLANRRLIKAYTGALSGGFSGDGEDIANFTSPDGVIKLCNMFTGRELASIKVPPEATALSSPGGKRLLVYGRSPVVDVFDTASGKKLAELKGHQEWVYGLDFSADGNLVATVGGDRTIRLWDLRSFRALAVIHGHENDIVTVGFSPDGRKLITGSRDRTAKIWDVSSLLSPGVLEGHSNWVFSVAFSPDSRRLATASEDHTVKLWNVATGKLLNTLVGHTREVFAVAFSPSDERLATASADKTVKIWDASTGQQMFSINDFTTLVRSVAFSPDGRMLATGSHHADEKLQPDDRTVRIFDAATGRELRVLRGHKAEVMSVAFSPDGRALASASWDNTVKLWDVETGRELTTFRGHADGVWSVAFSPDGKRLVTGGRDDTVRVWDAATGRESMTLTGHTDEVFSVAFSPDGARIASASNDHTVKLWDAATGKERFTFRDHKDQVWSVAFSPDGRTLASGSWDKTVRLYRAATEQETQRRMRR